MDTFRHNPGRVSHVAVISLFSFFAAVAVAVRLWARKVQRSRWEANDYLCIVALVFSLALSLFTIHSQVYWNLGEDSTQIGNPKAIFRLVRLQVIAMITGQILWAAAVLFVRASVLHLYTHIFRKKAFRVVCYIIHGINTIFFVSTVLTACLICHPIAYNWDRTIPGGGCGDQKRLDLFIGIFNLLMDVAVLILPMPVLWGLQMAVSKKIVLSLIFGMGVVICAITMIRVWVTTLIRGDQNAQKIYSMIALLTCLEALLGVVNACLPVMKPALTKMGSAKVFTWATSSFSSHSRSSANHPHLSASSRVGKHIKNPIWTRRVDRDSTGCKELSELPDYPHAGAQAQFADTKGAQVTHGSVESGQRSGGPCGSSAHIQHEPYRPSNRGHQASQMDAERWEDDQKTMPGIMVQHDWDVERNGSDETERNLLHHKI